MSKIFSKIGLKKVNMKIDLQLMQLSCSQEELLPNMAQIDIKRGP
jgi:hypothetical protein